MKAALSGILLLVFAAGVAQAATPFELYELGKYDAAITSGIAQNDAAGLAVAARSELAREAMQKERCLECIRRAQEDARKAIAADPRNADAHVFLAIALGREGRLLSTLTVLRRGYPTQAKAELDAAIAADSDNAFAWGALAGWNIELVHKGGARLASALYGASVASGLTDFNKAFALAPDNIALRYQYALTMSAYDVNAFSTRINDALMRVLNGEPHGAYEMFVRDRARELRDTLKKGDLDAYAALVSRDQGNPD